MLLKALIKNLTCKLSNQLNDQLSIQGICSHSKKIQKGELFIDWRGIKSHVLEAEKNGAAAIVSKAFFETKIPFICLKNFEKDIVEILRRFFDKPYEKLFMVGLTGTCGKTTTSYLIYHTLKTLGIETGLISSVETIIKEKKALSELSTTDVASCYSLLHSMAKENSKACVMEVTSHGLDQKRVEGIDFDVAIFTNLSHEHLDYHKTMDHYKASKKKLFSNLRKEAVAFINSDDPHSKDMVDTTLAKVITFGIHSPAEYQAINLNISAEKTRFELSFQDQTFQVETKLTGKFNIYNILACIAAVHKYHDSIEDIIKAIQSFPGAPGRLEKVSDQKNIYVDFAHKPNALENVLQTLKAFSQGKIITVVGCGGDRDKEKRPLMASIAEKYSDEIILTSDNPRSEDPNAIIKDMIDGIKASKPFTISDRRCAIEKAIEIAGEKDIVLIAGKGHEAYQIIKDKKYPFSDAEVVTEILSRN